MSDAGQMPKLSAPVTLENSGWGRHCFILCIVMPVVATALTALRFYARVLKNVPFQSDDWLTVVALIMYYILCVVAILGVVLGGIGHHITELEPSALETAGKTLVAAQNVYALALGFTKASALFLLRRVFGVNRALQVTVWATIALTVAWTLVTCLISLLICQPLAFNWDPLSYPNGHCGNEARAFTAVAVIDMFVDLVILILPMPLIWKLQTPVRFRVALMSLFALGYFDIVVAVLRLVGSLQINFQADWTFTIGEIYFWSAFEPGLAICVASAVVLRPVIDKILPAQLSDYVKRRQLYAGTGSQYNRFDYAGASANKSGAMGHSAYVAGTRDSAAFGDGLEEDLELARLTPKARVKSPSDDEIEVRRDVIVEHKAGVPGQAF